MLLVKAITLSAALAWWIVCALGNFYFLRLSIRDKRRGTISPRGDAFYDSARIGCIFMFGMAGLASLYLIWQTWQYVLAL